MNINTMATVLVVDDHDESRKPLIRLLQRQGYNAVGAATAYEAFAAVNHSKPDLILLDVMIPPMDGLTFLMRLHEDIKDRELPVIVVSGLSDPQTISRAKELGVKEHLVKTQFTPDDLLAVVKRHIRSPLTDVSPSKP
jgi:PleD family two-component response regulator